MLLNINRLKESLRCKYSGSGQKRKSVVTGGSLRWTFPLLRERAKELRLEGVEPPRLAAPEPKSGVSANSTTGASEARIKKKECRNAIAILTAKRLNHSPAAASND